VIVLGEDMRQVAIRSGAPSEKVVIIRNWADPIKIRPIAHEENRFRREWGLYGKFVVEYSGNLGVSHSFEDLLAVAESVADNDDIRFLFIGGGIRFRELERAVASRGLGNVIMMPYQKSSDLAHSLSAGDVHYVSLRTGFEGLVVPSKAYGIMAAGRPMIYQGDEKGDIAQMIKRERCGIVIPEGDRERLKEGILRFYRDRAMVARMGMFARRALEEKYSASIGLAEYRKVLAAVH
jgi:glycosyltransferase involved in cell wall biosynthesis